MLAYFQFFAVFPKLSCSQIIPEKQYLVLPDLIFCHLHVCIELTFLSIRVNFLCILLYPIILKTGMETATLIHGWKRYYMSICRQMNGRQGRKYFNICFWMVGTYFSCMGPQNSKEMRVFFLLFFSCLSTIHKLTYEHTERKILTRFHIDGTISLKILPILKAQWTCVNFKWLLRL